MLLVSAIGFYRRSRLGVWAYLLLTAATGVWAFQEVGLQFWPLVPRLAGILAILVPVCLLAPVTGFGRRRVWQGLAGVCSAILLAGFAAMFFPHGVIKG